MANVDRRRGCAPIDIVEDVINVLEYETQKIGAHLLVMKSWKGGSRNSYT